MTPGSRSALRVALDHIGRVERAVTFVAFLVLIGILFADVASRELTGAGIAWARQVGSYANLVVVMVGMGLASSTGAHLRPRFADRWLPDAWQPVLVRVQEALMALFCLALSVVAVVAVGETFALGERTANPRWVVWPFELVLPITFVVAGLRHAAFAWVPELRPAPDEERS